MKLYNKFIATLSIFMIGSLIGISIYISVFLMRSYEKLEEEFAYKNLSRIENVVQEKLENLCMIAEDWAVWDDTYKFIEMKNQEYIDSNLIYGGYLSTGADFIVFFDKDNREVYQSYYNEDSQEEEIPPYLIRSFQGLEVDNDEGVSGIIRVGRQLVLVAKYKIYRSDLSGIYNGYLILGIYIDDSFMAEISEIVKMNLRYSIEYNSKEKSKSLIVNEDSLTLRLELLDLEENSKMVIKTELKRDIFNMGKETVKKILTVFFILMLLMIMLTSYLLRESVLKSINQLLKEIKEISSKMENNEKLKIKGTDEFAELKSGINSMLSSLEDARSEINKSKEKYKTLYEESAAIHIILDADSNFIDVNNAMCKFLEMRKDDIIGKNIYDFIDEEEFEWLKEYIENVFVGVENEEIDIKFLIEGEREKTIHLYPNCLFLSEDNDQFSILITGTDISESVEMNKKLNEFATFDPMTGAYNRRVGLQMLEKRVKHTRRYEHDLSICFIDINGLKKVNDTLGHNEGDRLIEDSAKVLLKIIRDSDIIARLGGDEFLLILPNCSEAQAEEVWERVNLALEKVNQERDSYQISMSHGIIQYDIEQDWSVDEFVEIADKKMYDEKLRSKQNRVV